MIDPAKVCLFIPQNLQDFKLKLFKRIGASISAKGGKVINGDVPAVGKLPPDVIPIIGCHPEFTDLIIKWRAAKRPWIYWDRGAFRRVFACSLPAADTIENSYYRWHLNAFQMREIRKVPRDRWDALNYGDQIRPWQTQGRHIVIAAPSRSYAKFHRIESWIADTIDRLARVTDRQLVIRDKEHVRNRPLEQDLAGAHCLVTHGSNAAIESVVMGCPVFVHPDSAAALVGKTDLRQIEQPAYPERQPWLNALAYCQFNEHELVNGTLWQMIK